MTPSSTRRRARRAAAAAAGHAPRRTATVVPARTQPPTAIVLGGAAWIVGTLQVQLAQISAAAAWNPPYNWMTNYISDLGNTACGQFAVPHGAPSYVCSPLYLVMDASFVVSGVLTIVGAVLLQRIWPPGRLTKVALVLWVITGLGKIIVGVVPENTIVELHLVGALNIPIGSIAILLNSLSVLRTNRGIALTGIVLTVVGLVGTVLSTAGQFNPSLYVGLGVGGMERVSEYPGLLWMFFIGVIAIRDRRRVDQAVAYAR